MAGKLRLENLNYCTGTSCLHALDFIETSVVIDCDDKIFVSELKQIHCDFVPWSFGYFMGQHWLLTLFGSVCTAGSTFADVISDFMAHSRPVNFITGSA